MAKHEYFKIKQRGFTIIEILIVIVVLGILATIGYYGLQFYRDNINQMQITNTADAYVKSLKAYALEYNKYPQSTGCLPAGSICCYNSVVGAAQYTTCDDYGGSSGNSPINQYINKDPPTLPNDYADFRLPCNDPPAPSGIDCTFDEYYEGIITIDKSVKLGVYYAVSTTDHSTLYGSSDPSIKGVLIYYIPPKYTCGVSNIIGSVSFMGYGPDPQLFTLGAINPNAKHTEKYTNANGSSYVMCAVAIK